MVVATETSFEAFYDRHHVRLFRGLCLMTGNRTEAEDIMQEAFLAVWERWDHVSTMDRPDGYLFRTAMNTFRKRLRRSRLAARIPLVPEPPDDLADVEHRDELIRSLRMLTPHQRASLILSALFGYSTDEIGEMLGCRPTTVRVHLSRARGMIRGQNGG